MKFPGMKTREKREKPVTENGSRILEMGGRKNL